MSQLAGATVEPFGQVISANTDPTRTEARNLKFASLSAALERARRDAGNHRGFVEVENAPFSDRYLGERFGHRGPLRLPVLFGDDRRDAGEFRSRPRQEIRNSP